MIFISADQRRLVHLVAAQAATQFNVLGKEGRRDLLEGLRILLPAAEFEQCAILVSAINEAERAKERAADAQMLFGEMISGS